MASVLPIREIHGVLLSKGRGSDRQPGEFRQSQNWIGGTRPGTAAFVPPPQDLVLDCLGRLLITFLLCAAGVLREPILYLSLYFKQHRSLYYELLDRVWSEGDWERWLEFFLTEVRDTAEQAASAARRILALFDDHRRKIESLGRPAASVLRVFEHLQRNAIVSIPAASNSIGISQPTVARSLDHLQQLGLLREATGRQRRRIFVYDAYLAILSEGTEPIR